MRDIKHFLKWSLPIVLFTIAMLLAIAANGENREIKIIGDINITMAFEVVYQLEEFDKTPGDITIYIDSNGGEVLYGFMIIDSMNKCENDIRTVALSHVYSMSTIVLSAGTKGKRYAHKHSLIMMHQMMATTGRHVSMDQFYGVVESTIKIEKWYYEEIANNTGKKILDVKNFIREDKWMTSEEALSFGLIDAIIKK